MALEELKGRPCWDYFTGFERHGQLKLDRIVDKYNKGGAKSPIKPKCYLLEEVDTWGLVCYH
jgi:hypothetical protein